MNIKILIDELWYPAVSLYGSYMPFDKDTILEVKLQNNITPNQMTPLLLSSKGRILYREDGFTAKFDKGSISLDKEVEFVDTKGDLKSAFLYARDKFFRGLKNKCIDDFVERNVYNTWMHAPFDVTEGKVLDYANKILADGLDAGIIMIDDKWSKAYGDWEFDVKKFNNPKKMIADLKAMGFALMLWVCPYIDFDSEAYEFCKENDYLLKDGEEIYRLEWWNGESACFDFRKEEVRAYWTKILSHLQDLGVDGFKFDGGDSMYYKDEHEPDRQSYLWASFASDYSYNELRAGFNTSALPLFQRLSDKRHTWGDKGISSLLPSALALGLAGSFVYAPDMIGGGEVNDIREGCKLKKDIFLAHTQAALLMPNMQFSILPKLVFAEDYPIFLELLKTRKEYRDYIKYLHKNTREPINRLLEYEFPNSGYGYEKQAFMLGDKYLVLPVVAENQCEREFKLPEGRWKYGDKIYENRETLNLSLSLDRLLVLEKILD